MRPASFLSIVTLLAGSIAAGAQTPTPAPAAASATATAPSYASDPRFTRALEEARQFEARRQIDFAGEEYKKANKIANGQCMECLQSLYNAQIAIADYKAAIVTASAWEALAAAPSDKSTAQTRRAQAMLDRAGDKAKPAELEAVHAVLQQALTTYPRNPPALFVDGKVLARLGRLDQARSDFQQCGSCMAARDPSRLRVQHFAENPELSLHKMAPAFEVTALDGRRFNLDAMGGRVVLIDFWATWCGPCNEALPEVQKMAKEFAGQPLVIISVSWDSNEQAWKDFIARHEMTWVQYRDADHKLSTLFGVNAIPHYFTIDADGVLTAEMLGEDATVEGKIKKLLARARETQTSAPAPAQPSLPSGN
jgi:thiol-disulfide isomerase/thioredoxin